MDVSFTKVELGCGYGALLLVEAATDLAIQLVELMTMLVDTDVVSLALHPQSFVGRRMRCNQLNEVLISRAMKGQDCGFLMSPITGSAHSAKDIHQLFVLAAMEQKDQIQYAWSALKRFGRSIARNGVVFVK